MNQVSKYSPSLFNTTSLELTSFKRLVSKVTTFLAEDSSVEVLVVSTSMKSASKSAQVSSEIPPPLRVARGVLASATKSTLEKSILRTSTSS